MRIKEMRLIEQVPSVKRRFFLLLSNEKYAWLLYELKIAREMRYHAIDMLFFVLVPHGI